MVSASLSENRAWAIPTGPSEGNRHRKGDTYAFGGKPYDPLDPGPWLWKSDTDYRPDRRIGRHRRGELPDPIRERRRPRPSPEPVHSFGKLREDAWVRFIDYSAVLAESHTATAKASRARRLIKRLWSLLRV